MNDECHDSNPRKRKCDWANGSPIILRCFAYNWIWFIQLNNVISTSVYLVNGLRRHTPAGSGLSVRDRSTRSCLTIGSSAPFGLLRQLESIISVRSDSPARLAPLCSSSSTHTRADWAGSLLRRTVSVTILPRSLLSCASWSSAAPSQFETNSPPRQFHPPVTW